MDNVFHVLKERGFIYQSTDDRALEKLLGKEKVTCYIGFDATADSLHVGSLVPVMALVHMQRHGHRPIALLGGGTTMVGDPSGRTEMRKMMTVEQIEAFGKSIEDQLKRFLDFENGRAIMLNNAQWLLRLNYITFLREIGRHFSVNRMLTAESYKQRLETGLSFIEFNYMLLQAYDFYVLARDHGCVLQMGGQDQWGNIVAGSDLTRRMMGKEVYGMTFPLLLKADGEKFGKSATGTVWLDRTKTSPFEFYQYWRNIDDQDIVKCLSLLTLLPMEEVNRLPGENINRAKEILAFEITRLAHGEEEAAGAFTASARQFGESDPERKVKTSSSIMRIEGGAAELPAVILPEELLKGVWIVRLLVESGLCRTNGEARRLIQQGGAYVNDEKVESEDREISKSDVAGNELILRAGKKRYRKIIFQ